jgi:hypothetical protein
VQRSRPSDAGCCEIRRVIDRGDEAADSSVDDLLVAVDLLAAR